MATFAPFVECLRSCDIDCSFHLYSCKKRTVIFRTRTTVQSRLFIKVMSLHTPVQNGEMF